MKRISLSVLNLVCQQLTDESKIIGPIEPAPQPTSPQSQEHSSWRSGDSAYFSQTPQSSNQHISPNLQTLLASPEMYTHSPTVEVDQAINTKISSPGPNDYWNTKSFAKPTVEYRSMAVATAAQSGTISEDIWFECPPWPQEEISSVGQDEDRKIWDFMDSTQLEELSRTPAPADLASKDTVLEAHEKRSVDHHFNTLGKASPYSSKSQDAESESTYETETESNEEDWQRARSPFDSISLSDVDERKKVLFVETLSAFWNIYNQQYLLILSKYATSMTICAAGGPSSNSMAQSQSTSSTAAVSSVTNSFDAPTRRTISDDDDHPPHDDRSRGPKRPYVHSTPAANDQPLFRVACPFRKHNPQKYNMHHPGWKCCATSSFESVSRTK
jgi:hypothetical protein